MTAFAAIALGLRVFSADYCADQLVLALADRGDIAALSVDAEKDFSYLRRLSDGVAQARADVEQAAASGADLVLRYWGGDAARLEKLGMKVVTLSYAADFDGVFANVRTAAAAIGRPERGEALIGKTQARLAALAAKGPAGVTALYVTPGGVTAGKETMVDAIFSAAGVENAAAAAGLSYWPPLTAEALIADPPQVVVAGFFSSNSERINHWSAARHPALRKTMSRIARIDLPADVLSCPAWYSIDAAEMLREAVDRGKASGHE